MALQMKNKFEGLGDIILRVMGQLPVLFSVEVTVMRDTRQRNTQNEASMQRRERGAW
jgi:hypothetical protein|eukprot:COSAG01_NODE_1504_length_10094_cov_24.449925_12_plen_57_part_00